ncbi:hypothetical protein ACH9L7_17690 (plasmid) [Haloferax sp. S1W]|uniref:hypothetical protein n=1 Tax=Haloferax sp. S1W TaxID=3377110 RepID=UPI0037C6DA9A
MPHVIDQVRRPEYTGENRCTPCTVLNVGIAAVAAGLLALLWIPAGLFVFAVSLTLIYLRGYLVPYTPTITKRYLPDRVLRRFDKQSSVEDEPTLDEVKDIDIEQTLYSLDVLTECENVDDLCLDPEFENAWQAHTDALRERDDENLGIDDLLELDNETEYEVRKLTNEAAVVMINGRQIGQWESKAALRADLAADRALREWDDDWGEMHVVNRSQVLNSLRMFLGTCTECGAPVNIDQETVESCCRSFEVFAVACEECGSRFFEIELTDEMQQQL